MNTTVDTIRAIATYSIAFTVVIGGGLLLYDTRGEPANDLAVIVAGFIGSALTFVFGSEVQTRTARQHDSSMRSGAWAHANGLAGTQPPQGDAGGG